MKLLLAGLTLVCLVIAFLLRGEPVPVDPLPVVPTGDLAAPFDVPAAPGPSPQAENRLETERERRQVVEEGPREPDRPFNRAIAIGDVPADPVETGECTLRLLLLDRATLAGVQSKIDLWRLDAPGNAEWARGDQLQLRAEIPEEGCELGGLPEGEYRVVVHAGRSDQPGSPPVVLRTPGTVFTVYVDRPELLPAWLKLTDGHGRPIQEAVATHLGSMVTSVAESAPDWVERRQVKDPNKSSVQGGGAGGSFSGTHFSGYRKPVVAGPRGFELGPFPADAHEGQRTDWIRFQRQGYCDVRCTVWGADREQRTYAGVMIRPDRIYHAIRLPDGTTADSFPAAVRVTSGTILEADARTGAPWREAPIDVTVEHPDYQRLNFRFRLEDEPLETRVLQPKKGNS